MMDKFRGNFVTLVGKLIQKKGNYVEFLVDGSKQLHNISYRKGDRN
jgi:hypothetical protein